MDIVKLSNFKIGQYGNIVGYSLYVDEKLKRRRLELGFCLGTKIRILYVSVFNKVALVEINGYVLSIRKNILKNIYVEVVNA